MLKERNVSIDIAKGIGIILVVFGHIHDFGCVDLGFSRTFVYSFHVPLFFFLSGIFYNHSESLVKTCKKKFTRLYLPFIIANLLYFLLELFLGKRYPFTEILKILGGLTTIASAGPTWFLVVLFRVFILYKILDILSKGNEVFLTVAACSLGLIGTYITGKYWIGQTLVALCFFHLGKITKSVLPYLKNLHIFIKTIIVLLLSVLTYVISTHNETVYYVWGMYQNRFLFFVGSITGIALTIIISDLFSNISLCRRALSPIGKKTLPILILHFLAIWSLIKIREYFCIDGAPLLWVIICLLLGVSIPYFLSVIFSKLLDRIKSVS